MYSIKAIAAAAVKLFMKPSSVFLMRLTSRRYRQSIVPHIRQEAPHRNAISSPWCYWISKLHIHITRTDSSRSLWFPEYMSGSYQVSHIRGQKLFRNLSIVGFVGRAMENWIANSETGDVFQSGAAGALNIHEARWAPKVSNSNICGFDRNHRRNEAPSPHPPIFRLH